LRRADKIGLKAGAVLGEAQDGQALRADNRRCVLLLRPATGGKQHLAFLFDDHDRESAGKGRSSPVAPAKISAAAYAKAASRKTADGLPVHSFRTLLQNLGTLTRNTVHLADAPPATMLAKPTPPQQAVFGKLEVHLNV
jgi:hypothetical protein